MRSDISVTADNPHTKLIISRSLYKHTADLIRARSFHNNNFSHCHVCKSGAQCSFPLSAFSMRSLSRILLSSLSLFLPKQGQGVDSLQHHVLAFLKAYSFSRLTVLFAGKARTVLYKHGAHSFYFLQTLDLLSLYHFSVQHLSVVTDHWSPAAVEHYTQTEPSS